MIEAQLHNGGREQDMPFESFETARRKRNRLAQLTSREDIWFEEPVLAYTSPTATTSKRNSHGGKNRLHAGIAWLAKAVDVGNCCGAASVPENKVPCRTFESHGCCLTVAIP